MRERSKGKTLVARDEGDDADGVVTKLYGEETNGAISIISSHSSRFSPTATRARERCLALRARGGDARPGRRGGRQGDTRLLGAEPRQTPHTIWNAGPEPARIIELYTPGGFELFFRDFGERLRQGPIGLDELNRLGEPHGIRFFDDWIPDLKAAYKLRLIGE
jgi:hypothetical protein